MRRIAKFATNPVVIALVASLAIAGCASKKTPQQRGRSRPRRRRGDARFGPGLHRQCRRPHLLRHRLLVDPRRRAGHSRPPGAVAEQVPPVRRRRRRPCRRARHPRIQPGARRPPCRRRPRLPGLAGRRRQPRQDHFLRQGTPGRRLRRHLLLVAEPPRRHHAVGRRQLIGKIATLNFERRSSGRLLSIRMAQTKFGRSRAS